MHGFVLLLFILYYSHIYCSVQCYIITIQVIFNHASRIDFKFLQQGLSRNYIILGMQLLMFFPMLLVMLSENFDVYSIAFVMYLLNGVPFQFCFNTLSLPPACFKVSIARQIFGQFCLAYFL